MTRPRAPPGRTAEGATRACSICSGAVLTAELTAINQSFIHARMGENWGYERLWKKIREESIGLAQQIKES